MSDVLVDTSAWIEFFHYGDSRAAAVVSALLREERVCTMKLVMVEITSGAKDRNEFEQLKSDFKILPQLDLPVSLWEDMAEVRWQLKMKGIAGISIPDLIIALAARAHHKTILTCDRDFLRMQSILHLSLFEIPQG